MAETILAKMAVQIAANTAEFNKALAKSESQFKNFTSGITKLAGTIGVAFGAQQVAAFTVEIAKLAGEADGVRAAFEKLPASAALMEDLKEATGGTVSELELMKRTVQATNFGINLEALPKLLEFAAVRAQQTGQSVDYLVDSIVTGIGRKSPLILDNLGISTSRLKEQFGGAALEAQSIGDVAIAVGKIAEEELTNMGELTETSATKMARLSASWEDFKVVLGGLVSGPLGSAIDGLTELAEVTSIFFGGKASNQTAVLENQIKLLNESGIEGEQYAEALKVVEATAKSLGVNLIKLTDEASGVTKVLVDTRTAIKSVADGEEVKVNTLDALQEKIKQLNQDFNTTDVNDKKKLENIGKEIIGINSQIEALEKLRKKQKEVNDEKLSAFGRQQLADAQTRATGETPLTAAPIEFKFGEEDERDLTNIFPTDLPAPNVDLFMNNVQMATAAIKELGVTGVQSYDQMRLAGEMQREEQERQTAMAQQFGQVIGDALGTAISGQESFANSLKSVTKKLLQLFLQQALGAAIAGAFKTAKNPILGAVLAGVATGVVSSMFSKIGGPSKSVSGAVSRPAETTSTATRQALPNDQIVLVGGEFRLKGNDLFLSLEKTRKEKQRTG